MLIVWGFELPNAHKTHCNYARLRCPVQFFGHLAFSLGTCDLGANSPKHSASTPCLLLCLCFAANKLHLINWRP